MAKFRNAFKAKLYTELTSDPPPSAVLTDAYFGIAGEEATYPFLNIPELNGIPDDTWTDRVMEFPLQMNIFSDQSSSAQVDAIEEDVRAHFHRMTLEVSADAGATWKVTKFEHQRSVTFHYQDAMDGWLWQCSIFFLVRLQKTT